MWLFDKWREWSQSQYDLWGSKLQDRYNFWKECDNPELREICKRMWDILPADIQKKIYEMVVAILVKYGPDVAKKIVEALINGFINESDKMKENTT